MPLLPPFPFSIGSRQKSKGDPEVKAVFPETGSEGCSANILPVLQVADKSGRRPSAESRSAVVTPPRNSTDRLKAEEDNPFEVVAPKELYSGYDPKKVLPWQEQRFQELQLLADAKRNRGTVHLMKDLERNRSVAVKQMPNWWICKSHGDFLAEHPSETELPWQDIGCTKFLNSVDFGPACSLYDVYRSATHTFVVSSFASEGDLFTQCQVGVQPGPERENDVSALAVQILSGVKNLHDLSIAHRDISLENILVTKSNASATKQEIRIIDYSMATSGKVWQRSVRGKASYQAPELHNHQEYDSFLSDTFSVGVTLYALLMMDYPWQSTKPNGCKCFEYVQKHGFRAYCQKRKIRGSQSRVADAMSEPLMQLLEGMLAIDPASRLTLGERRRSQEVPRRSVWDEPWTKKAWEQAVRAGAVPPAFLPRSVSL
jgi:serine/threonine protein kinase